VTNSLDAVDCDSGVHSFGVRRFVVMYLTVVEVICIGFETTEVLRDAMIFSLGAKISCSYYASSS